MGMDDLSLLRLQMEWGADEALDDAPVDRLRAPVPASNPPPRPRPVPVALAPSGTPAERALRVAAQAGTMEELKAAIMRFEGDPLRDMASNLVFASGNPAAELLLIGGAPGAGDDRSGVPFSGPEGALLDQMLASVGLTRDAMLLSPLIPWRPPGGRVPSSGEIQLYRPFLMRMIALAAPERIVLFGTLAAGTVLGSATRPRSIGWIEAAVDGRPVQVLVLPALAEIMKTATRRRDAWAGMRALRRVVAG